MAAINIPVILENEYPLFQSIGIKSEFPGDYSAFLKLLEQKNKDLINSGVIPVYVDVDFTGFRKWFPAGKYATYSDLICYTTILRPKLN